MKGIATKNGTDLAKKIMESSDKKNVFTEKRVKPTVIRRRANPIAPVSTTETLPEGTAPVAVTTQPAAGGRSQMIGHRPVISKIIPGGPVVEEKSAVPVVAIEEAVESAARVDDKVKKGKQTIIFALIGFLLLKIFIQFFRYFIYICAFLRNFLQILPSQQIASRVIRRAAENYFSIGRQGAN